MEDRKGSLLGAIVTELRAGYCWNESYLCGLLEAFQKERMEATGTLENDDDAELMGALVEGLTALAGEQNGALLEVVERHATRKRKLEPDLRVHAAVGNDPAA